MIKNFFINTTLLIVFTLILAVPFIPSKLIKYYPEKNVLATSSKGGIKVESAGDLSRIVEVTVYPHQFAYYDNVFELRNFSNKDTFYKIENFTEGEKAKVTAEFSNGVNEILLHPNEKTYVNMNALGMTNNIEQIKIFLEISTENIK